MANNWLPDVVLFHAQCADGFGAAWAVRCGLGDHQPEYVPVQYNQDPPDVFEQRVLIVDFSYPAEVLQEMAEEAHSVVVLDHHGSASCALVGFRQMQCQLPDVQAELDVQDSFVAMGKLPQNVLVRFNAEESGATLAWDFANPGKPRPPLVEYLRDRDLWQWQLEQSREIASYVSSWPFDFAQWDQLRENIEERFTACAAAGRECARYLDTLAARASEDAYTMQFLEYEIMAFSCAKGLISTVCSILLRDNPEVPFVMGYCDRSDGQREYSLRGRPDGLAVNEIAERFPPGGGHRNAAGFSLPSGMMDAFVSDDVEYAQ